MLLVVNCTLYCFVVVDRIQIRVFSHELVVNCSQKNQTLQSLCSQVRKFYSENFIWIKELKLTSLIFEGVLEYCCLNIRTDMLKLHIELEYTPHQNAPRGAECGLRRGSMGSSIPIRTLLYTGEYQPHMNHDNYENALHTMHMLGLQSVLIRYVLECGEGGRVYR